MIFFDSHLNKFKFIEYKTQLKCQSLIIKKDKNG